MSKIIDRWPIEVLPGLPSEFVFIEMDHLPNMWFGCNKETMKLVRMAFKQSPQTADKGSREQQTDNSGYITALERLKLPERGEKRRGWNKGIEACIEEIQRLHSLKAANDT
jgi:hypothetical protein